MASLTVKASLKSLVSFARGTSLVGETRLVHITTDHSVNKLFGHKGNGISTGKYNLVTFFPKGLYEQFRRVANLYFLSVAIISLFEAISPIKPYTIWAPLCLVVGLSMTKEAVEDYGRHKQDHEQNTSLTEKFDGTSMTQCEWRDIRAGDVVRVVRDQAFPCDLILLASPLDDAVCYVETKNLDGETNLKLKRGVEGCGVVGERGTKGLAFLKTFAGVVGNEANAAGTDAATIQSVVDAKADQVAPVIEPESRGIRRFTRLLSTRRAKKEDPPDPAGARVECEHPNNSLYTFTGNLDVPKGAYDGPLTEDDVHLFPDSKKKLSLVPYNVLLRGSSLRNTEWVLGVAIYTGHDTKVMMNSSAAPSKRSQIEYGMDRVVLMMLLLLLTMGTVTAIVCGVWIKNDSLKNWYLRTDTADMVFDPTNAPLVGIVAFLTSYVLYGYLIPISLYVSLEFVKVMQATVFINQDRALYHAETDTPMRARTSNLNEELGMVHTVLSDKTGTLTCNSMEFFKMSIAGGSYGAGVTEIERAVAKRNGNPLPPAPTHDSKGAPVKSGPIEPGFNFKDSRIDGGGWMTHAESRVFVDFFRVLAVCHTVIPEGDPKPATVCYQAESPDESAFVVAAKRFGFFFKARHTTGIDVEEPESIDNETVSSSTTKRFDILNILEFNSTRKRMSVICRTPEGTLVLYCKAGGCCPYIEIYKALTLFRQNRKGADSVIYERLRHVPGGQTHAESTQAHMDDYAASGLRTLCLAKRELTKTEYDAWNETYTEAAQSLEKRDEKIDACAEVIENGSSPHFPNPASLFYLSAGDCCPYIEICKALTLFVRKTEKDLELLGATAIEDKLQDGVPQCIEQLMRAGISVWVLTGDKQDTAINIGQACSLLREDMKTHVININELIKLEGDRLISKADFDTQGREQVRDQIKKGIELCDECSAKGIDMGVVIDGRSLAFALEPNLAPDFLSLGTGCVSVVCCRVSPLQKALVTGLVKDSGKITLAIGDGANDVGMIQAAHIGVGISGQEGMQAVMAADFAFAQFRFLERLLLVHGRYNYKRVSRMVTCVLGLSQIRHTPYFFYKNIAFGLTLFLYNLETRASGQVVYNDWLMSAFNIFFVSLPVLALGCFDQDISQTSCLRFPQLYKQGQDNACFTWQVQLYWALNATYVSLVTYTFVFYGVHGGEADHVSGRQFGLWEIGTVMYTGIVITINLQMAQMINYWTWVQHVAIWGSILIWYASNCILSDSERYLSTYSYKIFLPTVAPAAKFWTATPLIVGVALLPDLIIRSARRVFAPESHHLVQEFERIETRTETEKARGLGRGGSGNGGSVGDAEKGQSTAGTPTSSTAATSGGTRPSNTPSPMKTIGEGGPASPVVGDSNEQIGEFSKDTVLTPSKVSADISASPTSADDSSACSSLDERGTSDGDGGRRKTLRTHVRRASAERIDVEHLSGKLKNYDTMRNEMASKGLDFGAGLVGDSRGREHSSGAVASFVTPRPSSTTSSTNHSRNGSSVYSEGKGDSFELEDEADLEK